MPVFQFALGQSVRLEQSKETGKVIGRAEYVNSQPSYLVRYICADGRQVETWWGQDALTDQ